MENKFYDHYVFDWSIQDLQERFFNWNFKNYKIVGVNVSWFRIVVVFEREYEKPDEEE